MVSFLCRNISLTLGECPNENWQALDKGLWIGAMSPFETKFVDIRQLGSNTDASINVSMQEGCDATFWIIFHLIIRILSINYKKNSTCWLSSKTRSWIFFHFKFLLDLKKNASVISSIKKWFWILCWRGLNLIAEQKTYRLVFLASGTMLLLLAPFVCTWVPFYYSSAMTLGVILVVLILLFQVHSLFHKFLVFDDETKIYERNTFTKLEQVDLGLWKLPCNFYNIQNIINFSKIILQGKMNI